MRKIVTEAIESVPLITKDHILLVQTLLSVRWISRSEDIIELYHKFILSLLTSKNDFLMLCLSKIIECFIPEGECEAISSYSLIFIHDFIVYR